MGRGGADGSDGRLAACADLSGDHTPVHVDEEYATASHFGGLVAHGLFGLAIADGLKTQSDYRFLPGMSLGWTWDFVAPILVGWKRVCSVVMMVTSIERKLVTAAEIRGFPCA